jgi:hypothetical protein
LAGYGPEDAEWFCGRDRLVGSLVERVARQRFVVVQELLAQGESISAISRSLKLDRKTVRRFAQTADIEELLIKQRDGRPGPLERFKPYLRERWNQGCTTATVCWPRSANRATREAIRL